jgi:hypothetical protein
MKKKALTILIFSLFACSGGSGSGVDISGLPDTSVPPGAANADVFDVWTFVATVTSSNCPNTKVGETMSSELRLASNHGGCDLSAQSNDGSFLTDSHLLFDPEETLCEVGQNVVSLDWSVNPEEFEDSDCDFQLAVATSVQLEGETLSGTYGGNLKVSGDCSDENQEDVSDISCRTLATMVGTKGRQLPAIMVNAGSMKQGKSSSKGLWN